MWIPVEHIGSDWIISRLHRVRLNRAVAGVVVDVVVQHVS